MLVLLRRSRFLLMCVASIVVCSTHGQNPQMNVNSLKDTPEANDDIEHKATSLFGSRLRNNVKNHEFNENVFGKSLPMTGKRKETKGIFGNNMEYKYQMAVLERKQARRFNAPSSRTSFRKNVKRIQKMKTTLHNMRRNSSKPRDSSHRNASFSSVNITPVNSQPKVYSDINKYRNVPLISKEIRNNQDLSNIRSRVSQNYVSQNGPKDLNGNLLRNSLSSLNTNGPVNVLSEHSENGRSYPCSCFWSKEKCGCSCNDSLIYDDFQELSKSFHPCSNFSFTISGGKHFSLPPNLFTRIGHVQNIHIKVTNATFDYLFDATPYTSAFRGVSFEKTALIELLGVRVRRGWNWTPLEYLNSSSGAGVEIKLQGCGLKRLSSDFGKVADGKVGTASISDSRLEMIGSGAFASFNDLSHFRLPRNRLRSIKRTDLPIEPLNLEEIDLRNNQLQSLEPDLFSEMPSLKTISLAGNPLRVLSETTFSRIISRASVPGLSNFPLLCDCRMRWLKNSSITHNDVALSNVKGMVCKRPPHLRGTPFKDLSTEHLMC